MIFTPNQVQEMMDIMHKQSAVFIGTTLGHKYLSYNDIEVLDKAGIDHTQLYNQYKDHVWLNFQLGLLSEVLGDEKVSKMSFNEFKSWLYKGNAIPLSEKEGKVIESVKYQSLSDIRANNNKIFQDINGIISAENINQKTAYEEIIRNEVIEGMRNRESIKKVISNLGHKTGDWSRDFSKSVEYISHSALNEGKSHMIQRKGGEEAKVYFIVQQGACKHCVSHYLTNGEGSEPKVFTIKELLANGSNIGKKVANWKATIHSMHPFCRCLMQELMEGYVWSEEKGKFVAPDIPKFNIDRPKIKVKIGEKEVMV
jgi:hypothetical protein